MVPMFWVFLDFHWSVVEAGVVVKTEIRVAFRAEGD